jgi:hypothetical protein
VVIHRDHAKQVIISLGDGFTGPVAIHIADFKVFKTPAERAVKGRHANSSFSWQQQGG